MGIYFATASRDRTARLWSTDRSSALRLYAGHLSDVDVSAGICIVESGTNVFRSASDSTPTRYTSRPAQATGPPGSGTLRKAPASESS